MQIGEFQQFDEYKCIANLVMEIYSIATNSNALLKYKTGSTQLANILT
jgi:hypothetical protein